MTLPLGRCDAANEDDPRPCDTRPDLVIVADPYGGALAGCRRHGAQLLATVEDARVYPLAGTEDDALRCAQLSLSRRPGDYREP